MLEIKNFEDAEKYLRSALEIALDKLSEDHFTLTEIYSVLGYCLGRLNKSREAIKVYEAGVQLVEENSEINKKPTRDEYESGNFVSRCWCLRRIF